LFSRIHLAFRQGHIRTDKSVMWGIEPGVYPLHNSKSFDAYPAPASKTNDNCDFPIRPLCDPNVRDRYAIRTGDHPLSADHSVCSVIDNHCQVNARERSGKKRQTTWKRDDSQSQSGYQIMPACLLADLLSTECPKRINIKRKRLTGTASNFRSSSDILVWSGWRQATHESRSLVFLVARRPSSRLALFDAGDITTIAIAPCISLVI